MLLNLQKIGLPDDTWKFLQSDDSPPGRVVRPSEASQNEAFEIAKLRRALREEERRREECLARIEVLENSLLNLKSAGEQLAVELDSVEKGKEVLQALGNAMISGNQFDPKDVADLCSSVGLVVGPRVKLLDWHGLPRIRIFDERLEISCNGSEPESANQDDLPTFGLVGEKYLSFEIFCNGQSVVYTETVALADVSDGRITLKLYRNGLELQDAWLSVALER